MSRANLECQHATLVLRPALPPAPASPPHALQASAPRRLRLFSLYLGRFPEAARVCWCASTREGPRAALAAASLDSSSGSGAFG